MKTLPINNWMTWKESTESMCAARRYNPATEISYKIPSAYCHKTVTLGAGTSDSLGVFYEGPRLYVVSTNQSLGYVGLQVFEDGEEVAETFMDGSGGDQTDYILGLTPIWRAKRLANWCDA